MSHPLLERSGSSNSSQPSLTDSAPFPSPSPSPSPFVSSSVGGRREAAAAAGRGAIVVPSHDIDSFFAMGGALTPRASDAGSPVKDHVVASSDSSPILMGSSLSFAFSHRGVHKDFDELVKMGYPPKKKPMAAEDIDSLLKISEATHPSSATAGPPATTEEGEATGAATAADTESLNGGLRASSSSTDLQQDLSLALTRSHVAGILLSVRSGQDIDTVLAAEPALSAAPRLSSGKFSSFPPRSYSTHRDSPESNLLDPSKTRSRYSAPNIFALFFRDEKQ